MASIGAIFSATYHTKQLKIYGQHLEPTSSVVIDSQLSACQGEMEPLKDHPSTHGHLTTLKNKPQKSNLGNFQHQYLPKLLVNVYSYR